MSKPFATQTAFPVLHRAVLVGGEVDPNHSIRDPCRETYYFSVSRSGEKRKKQRTVKTATVAVIVSIEREGQRREENRGA
jgi:hypothetical protein